MIRRNNILLLLAFCLVLSGLAYSQSFSEAEKKILELKDKRSLGDNQYMIKILDSQDEDAVCAALVALANIADERTIDRIADLLMHSKSSKIRMKAAFALGEFGDKHSADQLLNAFGVEKEPTVLVEILNGIGKVGNASHLQAVVSGSSSDEGVNTAIVMSIARFGIRKIRSADAISKLIELCTIIKNEDLRKVLAYAFNRAGDAELMPAAKEQLLTLAASQNPETRMWAWLALGKIQGEIGSIDFPAKFANETDWRVRVNMLVALNNVKDAHSEISPGVFESLLVTAAEDTNPHIAITAIQMLAKLYSGYTFTEPEMQKIKSALKMMLAPNKAIDWQIKSAAIAALAKLFREDVKEDLFTELNQTDNFELKAEAVRSLGYMDSVLVYRRLRDSLTAEVQRYNAVHPNKDGSMIGSPELAKLYKGFVDGLFSLGTRMTDSDKNNVRLIFSEFLGSKDPALVDACLTYLADSAYIAYMNETKQIIMFDYPELQYPKDYDVMMLFIQAMGQMKIDSSKSILMQNLSSDNYDFAKASADALKSITGKDYDAKIRAKKNPEKYDWDKLQSFEDFKTATLHTTKGNIRIRLLYYDAPFTALNFVNLAQKHFYDNTIFHRVVPNFVIQGGDPTGTGFGGPHYSIRSEFTPLSYETGMVGMASSGKDTEGSQFFITHSPAYHLDGRYTIFGKVISGLDAVDRIQVGDKIESVTFSSE